MTSGKRRRALQRYFVLRSHYLVYYENEKQTRTKGTLDLHDLRRCDLVQSSEGTGDPDSSSFTLLLELEESDVHLRAVPRESDANEGDALSDLRAWYELLRPFVPEDEL